jgi:glycosyltransferase involved in cell wall biosynthesis
MKEKTILIVTERFYPEEFIINELALEWIKEGFKVKVLTQIPSYPKGKVFDGYVNDVFTKEIWNNIEINRFFTVEGYNANLFLKILNYVSFAITGTVVGLFLAKKSDRIFIYQTGPLTLALPGVLLGRLFGKEAIIWTQDIWPDAVYAYGFKRNFFLDRFLNSFVEFIYSKCDKILVSCPGFKGKIKKYVPDKKIEYCPNWAMVNCSDYKSPPIRLSEKFNFVFAGNIGKLQNLENVIRGFKIFSDKNSSAQLNIIGDGSALPDLERLVRIKKIKNVAFHGRKSANEISAYLLGADSLIISLTDSPIGELTIPSKFQAYLTAGKPIFCIMHGEVEKLVRKHKLGICAKPASVKSIALGFTKFATLSDKEIETFGVNAKTLYESEFSREKIIDKITSNIR